MNEEEIIIFDKHINRVIENRDKIGTMVISYRIGVDIHCFSLGDQLEVIGLCEASKMKSLDSIK